MLDRRLPKLRRYHPWVERLAPFFGCPIVAVCVIYLQVDALEEQARFFQGPESMRALITMLRTAFPDLHFSIEELVAEGDTVAGRLTMSGTQEGPLVVMPPTGRPVRQNHMHFVRFRDGKAIEHWGVRDDLGMMRQFGVVPSGGPKPGS